MARAPVASATGLRVQPELSALGSLKSALSTLSASLEPLSDLDSFQVRSAVSSNEDLLTITADSSAVSGSYSVEVLQLAQSHKLTSCAFVDPEADVGTGTLTISVGDTSTFLFILRSNTS